ncbi:hypothetical protein G6514_009724 [Epicoccum nigrum]|nr:hypothetical protein G6514_009724 [Epicoccum nigrum]
MDNDEVIMPFEGSSSKVNASPIPSQPLSYSKPVDDFKPLPTSPVYIFYLAVTAPHTDKYEVHGPAPSFRALLPRIIDIASDSPAGLSKLKNLCTADDGWGGRVDNLAFDTEGFHTLILDGQRGSYTVLQVLAVENAEVKALLPAPVYTVTRHGPLVNTLGPLVNTYTDEGGKSKLGTTQGMAATSAFAGAFAERKDALEAARKAMAEMVEGVEGVARTETMGQGAEGGMLLAARPGVSWQVKVLYKGEVFRSAREAAEAEGKVVE